MTTTAIRGATLIDGTGRDPVRGASVVVHDGRITAVGPDIDVPHGAHEVDATGLTLLPGLVDCHVHVMIDRLDLVKMLSTSPSLALFNSIPILKKTLQAGVTTVRDAGGAPLGVKQAVEAGIVPGPRMQVSINILSQTGGHGDHFMRSCAHVSLFAKLTDIPNGVADGEDEVRKATREMLRAGADWIKLCTTGGVLSATDTPSSSQFTVPEIAAAVAEARAHGGKECMAHAQGTQGIKNAIVAGVKSIEHGIWLDEEAISMMIERDVYLVPTLIAPVQVLRQAEQNPASMPPWAVPKTIQVMKDHAESFRQAVAAGVKIAMGTDSGVGPHGENGEELALMVQHGMSPMEAIVASTSRAAELLRMQDRIGTVEPGKLADLILVAGEPLSDISSLQHGLKWVMKGGDVYRDELSG